MPPRFDYGKTAPGAYKAMESLERYLHTCGLEQSLIHLIKLRVSQVNGCAYCLDMHWKDLRAIGETEQRLYSLDAWEECPFYSDRERAALLWAEAVTRVADGHAPDSVYESVRLHFTEKQLADLTLAIATINAWNRLSIASRAIPGTYQVAATASSSHNEAPVHSGVNAALLTARTLGAAARPYEGQAYQAALRRRALTGKLAPAIECMLWYYAKGKPNESLDLAGRQHFVFRWEGDDD
jgi:AhpD family alkylhydroperoxidase